MTAVVDRLALDAGKTGYAEGFAAGYAAAEGDMAAQWAVLARRIRADAGRIKGPIAEPVVRPQPDDEMWFTAAEWAAWAGVR